MSVLKSNKDRFNDEVSFKFTGWADSFQGNAIYFPLQCALYQEIGNCDWIIKAKVEGDTLVYNPRVIHVTATRQHSSGHIDKKETEGFTTIEFSFAVFSYTKRNVYLGARKALSNLENGPKETKQNKN